MSDYTRIYLQPECCAGEEGRLWCQDDEPVTCPDGEKWTPYILLSEYTTAQAEIEALREERDSCKQQAQIWKQEARTQSAIVAEIYQELTGKTGEPGDWNGARPLKPAILRKQAEAVSQYADALSMWLNDLPGKPCASFVEGVRSAAEQADRQAQRIRAEAERMEGGEG